jgi:hypothetical protein
MVMVAFVSPRTAPDIDGALGGPNGVTEFEFPDGTDAPAALFATTVNVYVVPFVSPLTEHVEALANAVQVAPPGEAVTVYPVIGDPPSSTGGVQDICARALAPEAVADVGASGALAGVAVTVAVDDSESPTPLVAITRNV